MNATLESYQEPLRRIANEFIDERQGTTSKRKSDKKPLRRLQEYLEALEQCAEKLTQLTSKVNGLAFKLALLGLFLCEVSSFVPRLLNASLSEPKKEVAAVIQPLNVPTEPVKSDEVVQPSGPVAKHTAEKSGNSPTSAISKNLAREPLNPSFVRTRRSSHSRVAGNDPTSQALAETRSRQLLPRVSYPLSAPVELRFYDNRWHKRELPPANHPSLGAAGLPMNQSR